MRTRSAASGVRPGLPAPLGVHWDGLGVNVAVAAPHADGVTFCVFDPGGQETPFPLPERTGGIWHGYVPGIGPGRRYGLRAHGRYEPEAGLRFNAAKLLVDPYARLLSGDLVIHPAVYGYGGGDPYGSSPDPRDSAPFVPKGVVVPAGVDGQDDWRGDAPPNIPWADSVIYEVHVKGYTRLHPGLPAALRGTYAGLAHPAVVEHLVSLGITAVELLPVHAKASEPPLSRRGLTNYWGYSTLGFFAPHAGYAATRDPVGEFKAMVRALHTAGLEVILDVVYNHTAEGSERGPTLSLRGLDNTTYYRLAPLDLRRYDDVTGCGNTIDAGSPHALKLIMDSLRYWVTEMHVDGFRFDLATAMARTRGGFDQAAPFLAAVHADPVLSGVKLIAEPWDVGWGGYQVGSFPPPWAEWNGRFRDTVRDLWIGRSISVGDIGYRLAGSSDVYAHHGRRPWSSVNFVTSHDGFTLADLVSYTHKHNEANGEGNSDGDNDNRSTNCGVEGPTGDAEVLEVRRRLRRAHLATLMLSAGVPMLLAGDELGRSQGGNNNAYAQDNPVSWLAWPMQDERTPDGRARNSAAAASMRGDGEPDPAPDPAGPDPMLLPLVRGLGALRRRSPVLRRQVFFRGGPSVAGALADVTWFRSDGHVMTTGDWQSPHVRTLVAHLAGSNLPWTGPLGEPVTDANYLVVLHPAADDIAVTLPAEPWAASYRLLLDTAADDLAGFPSTLDDKGGRLLEAGGEVPVSARSVLLLRATPLVHQA